MEIDGQKEEHVEGLDGFNYRRVDGCIAKRSVEEANGRRIEAESLN